MIAQMQNIATKSMLLLLFCFINCNKIFSQNNSAQKWQTLFEKPFDKENIATQILWDSAKNLPKENVHNIIETLASSKANSSDVGFIKMQILKLRYAQINSGYYEKEYWRVLAETALHLSSIAEDNYLLQTTCNLLGNIHLQDGRSDTAIFYLMKAISLAEELGYKQEIIANDKIAASTALYQNKNYKECIAFCKTAIDIEKEFPRQTGVTAYNNLGLSYLKLNDTDSALFCFNKALAFCRRIQWGVWIGIISGNIGDALYAKGKVAAAMPYWQIDYDSSMKYNEQKNAGLTLAFMSQYEFDNGQQQKALSQLQWAQTTNAGDAVNLLRIYYIKAYCFRKIGSHDSADYFFKMHYALNDSLNQAVFKSNYNTVQMRLNFEKNEHDFKIIKSQRQAEINKRNLLLGAILGLLTLGILLYNRQRLKIKLALQQKEIAQAEKKSAKEQLQIFTDILLEKNEQIENLNASLQKQNTINTDELIHQTLLTDYNWNRFKDLFEKTYPQFFTTLKNAAPNITAAEMRLAALIKLNLDNKQMASMQGISVSSLRGYKTRLRQKLNISAEMDLEGLIKNF